MKARVGVFGIGLEAYWAQFGGLKARLEGYQTHVEQQIQVFGAELISAGLVDNHASAQSAADLFARADADFLVCYVGTYATSSTVLPVVQRAKVPVIVLNLQPVAALDYENTDTAEWLANCCACCVPEISNAFARAQIQFNVVSGQLFGDPRAYGELAAWTRAATAKRSLARSRIGFLGHTYPGMLDMYSDFTMVTAQTGAHVEILEMEDLHACVEAVTELELNSKILEIENTFEIAAPGRDKISVEITPESFAWSARVACGLDRLVRDFDLQGLTYYYRGLNGNIFEQIWAGLIVGNSLLTARGIPAAGEGDLKTCLAMKIMDALGAGGSYTEFYAMDFTENFVLMGHDGPGHIAISNAKPILRALGLYHGKRGAGISVEFSVKTGPITILGVTQTAGGKLKLLAAEGESLPGSRLNIGNTNSRLKFKLDPAEFMDAWCLEGPTHHVALAVGHEIKTLRKFARLTGLELVEIR
jgi:L-arabinose isomerase